MWGEGFIEDLDNGKGGYTSALQLYSLTAVLSWIFAFLFYGFHWAFPGTHILSFCPISCLSFLLPFLFLPLTPTKCCRNVCQCLLLQSRLGWLPRMGGCWCGVTQKACPLQSISATGETALSAVLSVTARLVLLRTSGRALLIWVYCLKQRKLVTDCHAHQALHYFFKGRSSSPDGLEIGDRKRESRQSHMTPAQKAAWFRVGQSWQLGWEGVQVEDMGPVQAESGRGDSKG